MINKELRIKNKPLTGFMVVAPMTVAVGEPVRIKIKALCQNRVIHPNAFAWKFPRLSGPANISARGLAYMDNVPSWKGDVLVDGGDFLTGPKTVCFDGVEQGVFPADTRAIKSCAGWHFSKPGIYFIKIVDPSSGAEGVSNPVVVTQDEPRDKLYWGDVHWQSFLTDGLRFPEELYDFARDEAFLDFGAASDHADGLTDRQWEYFKNVTNDYNKDGVFATLLGLEWSSQKYGHRNIYYPGDDGPIIRSNDSKGDTLEKLFNTLKGREALVIPHHSASADMGVNWDYGWNAGHEKSVEIASCWGSSECCYEDGNICPVSFGNGEQKGQHVIDALKKGFRFGFIGSGDIHDGRPGDALHQYQPLPEYAYLFNQGFAAAYAPALNRRNIFDAIAARRTYAANNRRIYVDMTIDGKRIGSDLDAAETHEVEITAASANFLKSIEMVGMNGVLRGFDLPLNQRIYKTKIRMKIDSPFCYLRLSTQNEGLAWVSPYYKE